MLDELKRIKFKEGYLTAQIESYVRMMGILDSLTETPPQPDEPGTHTSSLTRVLWTFLRDGRVATMPELQAHAAASGHKATSVNQCMTRLARRGFVQRLAIGTYQIATGGELADVDD